jgi:hypothetical protein
VRATLCSILPWFGGVQWFWWLTSWWGAFSVCSPVWVFPYFVNVMFEFFGSTWRLHLNGVVLCTPFRGDLYLVSRRLMKVSLSFKKK